MSDSKKVKFEGPQFKVKLKLSVKPGKKKDAKSERRSEVNNKEK